MLLPKNNHIMHDAAASIFMLYMMLHQYIFIMICIKLLPINSHTVMHDAAANEAAANKYSYCYA